MRKKSYQNIRIAIAQINTTVGDLDNNTKKAIHFIKQAENKGVDLISFPELTITGYPPEDLLLKSSFIDENLKKLKTLSKAVKKTVVVAGFVDRVGGRLYNAAAVIYNSHLKGVYHKVELPNYGVFDEKRYFEQGKDSSVYKAGSVLFGVNICEDIWHINGSLRRQVKKGAVLLVNINASPYHRGKIRQREKLIQTQAKRNNTFISYNNLVGGQDELVFDGQSMIVDNKGKIIAQASAFKEELLIADLNIPIVSISKKPKAVLIAKSFPLPRPEKKKSILGQHKLNFKKLSDREETYQALILGLKDYVEKNGFKKVVIGLSGGIDSSLVAAIAVDALKPNNVIGVALPSMYTSQASIDDARVLAKNLGILHFSISINSIFNTYLKVLKDVFKNKRPDITEENIQARIRGNILMALSNKFGWLVLNTGNKSEVSCGYCTLYGDMVGGFGILKDVPKTLVYNLAKFVNSRENKNVIPKRVFEKAPTAELRPHQKDADSLPKYDILDPILKAYVEEDKSFKELVAQGFTSKNVSQVLTLVDKSEYKRRQSAPGIKITPRAFGKDRRMPITNRYNT